MNQELITRWEVCRVCKKNDLTTIFSLGDLYVSDFLGEGDSERALKAPLELVLCNVHDGGCGLLQLRHTVSHETMYRNYWYRSGVNKTMTDELNGIAAKAELLAELAPGDFVIDIGTNDGTLLRGFKTNNLQLIGYEPAKNLQQYNSVGTTHVFEDFFSARAFHEAFHDAKAKVITAIAMFYDLENPNVFVTDIADCLREDGIFIIQMSYLPLMLSTNELGNVCHEHLEYYSLLSLENLLRRHGLEVFDVELNDINGGSFRIYIRHTEGDVTPLIGADIRVEGIREYEKKLGLDDKQIYDDFVRRAEALKEETTQFIKGEVLKGKKVYVYGASTKGNTVLQYFNLDPSLIVAAADRNPQKWGKRTVGTNIPIISEEQARKEMPDYFLVLPWHFIKEFREREEDFLKRGGKFIVPFPKFVVVSYES